jgi:type III secretion control protein HpaP
MTTIRTRALRVIPGELDLPRRWPTRRAGMDYGALARRPQPVRGGAAVQAPADATTAAWSGSVLALIHTQQHDTQEGTERYADTPDSGHSDESALSNHICGAAQPVVTAIFRTQGQLIDLAGSLVQDIAAFCGDHAVNQAGNWEAQVPLDPALLPNTTLYLSLSPFKLSLRFDTSDVDARQLLLNHGSTLECELGALLQAWGTPRDIELTVW